MCVIRPSIGAGQSNPQTTAKKIRENGISQTSGNTDSEISEKSSELEP